MNKPILDLGSWIFRRLNIDHDHHQKKEEASDTKADAIDGRIANE